MERHFNTAELGLLPQLYSVLVRISPTYTKSKERLDSLGGDQIPWKYWNWCTALFDSGKHTQLFIAGVGNFLWHRGQRSSLWVDGGPPYYKATSRCSAMTSLPNFQIAKFSTASSPLSMELSLDICDSSAAHIRGNSDGKQVEAEQHAVDHLTKVPVLYHRHMKGMGHWLGWRWSLGSCHRCPDSSTTAALACACCLSRKWLVVPHWNAHRTIAASHEPTHPCHHWLIVQQDISLLPYLSCAGQPTAESPG